MHRRGSNLYTAIHFRLQLFTVFLTNVSSVNLVHWNWFLQFLNLIQFCGFSFGTRLKANGNKLQKEEELVPMYAG